MEKRSLLPWEIRRRSGRKHWWEKSLRENHFLPSDVPRRHHVERRTTISRQSEEFRASPARRPARYEEFEFERNDWERYADSRQYAAHHRHGRYESRHEVRYHDGGNEERQFYLREPQRGHNNFPEEDRYHYCDKSPSTDSRSSSSQPAWAESLYALFKAAYAGRSDGYPIQRETREQGSFSTCRSRERWADLEQPFGGRDSHREENRRVPTRNDDHIDTERDSSDSVDADESALPSLKCEFLYEDISDVGSPFGSDVDDDGAGEDSDDGVDKAHMDLKEGLSEKGSCFAEVENDQRLHRAFREPSTTLARSESTQGTAGMSRSPKQPDMSVASVAPNDLSSPIEVCETVVIAAESDSDLSSAVLVTNSKASMVESAVGNEEDVVCDFVECSPHLPVLEQGYVQPTCQLYTPTSTSVVAMEEGCISSGGLPPTHQNGVCCSGDTPVLSAPSSPVKLADRKYQELLAWDADGRNAGDNTTVVAMELDSDSSCTHSPQWTDLAQDSRNSSEIPVDNDIVQAHLQDRGSDLHKAMFPSRGVSRTGPLSWADPRLGLGVKDGQPELPAGEMTSFMSAPMMHFPVVSDGISLSNSAPFVSRTQMHTNYCEVSKNSALVEEMPLQQLPQSSSPMTTTAGRHSDSRAPSTQLVSRHSHAELRLCPYADDDDSDSAEIPVTTSTDFFGLVSANSTVTMPTVTAPAEAKSFCSPEVNCAPVVAGQSLHQSKQQRAVTHLVASNHSKNSRAFGVRQNAFGAAEVRLSQRTILSAANGGAGGGSKLVQGELGNQSAGGGSKLVQGELGNQSAGGGSKLVQGELGNQSAGGGSKLVQGELGNESASYSKASPKSSLPERSEQRTDQDKRSDVRSGVRNMASSQSRLLANSYSSRQVDDQHNHAPVLKDSDSVSDIASILGTVDTVATITRNALSNSYKQSESYRAVSTDPHLSSVPPQRLAAHRNVAVVIDYSKEIAERQRRGVSDQERQQRGASDQERQRREASDQERQRREASDPHVNAPDAHSRDIHFPGEFADAAIDSTLSSMDQGVQDELESAMVKSKEEQRLSSPSSSGPSGGVHAETYCSRVSARKAKKIIASTFSTRRSSHDSDTDLAQPGMNSDSCTQTAHADSSSVMTQSLGRLGNHPDRISSPSSSNTSSLGTSAKPNSASVSRQTRRARRLCSQGLPLQVPDIQPSGAITLEQPSPTASSQIVSDVQKRTDRASLQQSIWDLIPLLASGSLPAADTNSFLKSLSLGGFLPPSSGGGSSMVRRQRLAVGRPRGRRRKDNHGRLHAKTGNGQSMQSVSRSGPILQVTGTRSEMAGGNPQLQAASASNSKGLRGFACVEQQVLGSLVHGKDYQTRMASAFQDESVNDGLLAFQSEIRLLEEADNIVRSRNFSQLPKIIRPSLQSLIHACKSGELLKALVLLDIHGLDPNTATKVKENTPVHVAAENGDILLLMALSKYGGDFSKRNSLEATPLICAASARLGEKLVPVIEYFKICRVDVNAQDYEGKTALHYACAQNNLPAAYALAQTPGMNVNIQDNGGWTALMWAMETKVPEFAPVLVNSGANVNILDKEGNSHLHWAAYSGIAETVTLLIKHGAHINQQTDLGDTPLHLAVRRNNDACVRKLLDTGRCDLSLTNKEDESAEEVAPLDGNLATFLSQFKEEFTDKPVHDVYTQLTNCMVASDISSGREAREIPAINELDGDLPPQNYHYITSSVQTCDIPAKAGQKVNQFCRCLDNGKQSCTSLHHKCRCLMKNPRGRLWYDENGLLDVTIFKSHSQSILYECTPMCRCHGECPNRVVQRGSEQFVELFKTEAMGWGVRASCLIRKGSFVCEYVGEHIPDAEANSRPEDSYIFDLFSTDAKKSKNRGELWAIDAQQYGNVSRFINHSCEPNLRPMRVLYDHQDARFPHMAFFAISDIPGGAQLSFDYGESFWKVKKMACQCNLPCCRYKDTS